MGVGKNIAKIRQVRGLTQEELAEQAKINEVYLELIEEERRNPHIKTIARIADSLGVSIIELKREE